jgi:hypothetical protein
MVLLQCAFRLDQQLNAKGLEYMNGPNEKNQYHIRKKQTQPVEDRIRQASRQELEKWANDPNCIEMELCATELADRQAKRENSQPAKAVEGRLLTEQKLPWSRQGSEEHPFNPRTEVSADAKHIASKIVTHLWIIFILLPLICLLLWELVK